MSDKISPVLIAKGRHSEYQWLTTEFEVDGLARLCPKIVTGKYLAVTSFDSGSLSLSDEKKANGWQSRAGIAYSPRIEAIESLPGTDGYDEWYVFESPADLGALCHTNPFVPRPRRGQLHAYVNLNLVLHDSESDAVRDLFWEQMNWINPESFLGESSQHLSFATKNRDLFSAALESISNSNSTATRS
ncbi:MAG: hypothetical protein WCF88_03010 [Candidatus Acidiferrales bacterium]